MAALIALWLVFPSAYSPSLATAGGKKAPANSLLVGTRSLGNATLYIFNLTTSSYRPLKLTGGRARWSRDGTRMALTRKEGNFMQLFVAAADGANPERLTDLPGDVIDCLWSADGRLIYFLYKSGVPPEGALGHTGGGRLPDPGSQAIAEMHDEPLPGSMPLLC